MNAENKDEVFNWHKIMQCKSDLNAYNIIQYNYYWNIICKKSSELEANYDKWLDFCIQKR